jgi:hypothetical protein
MCARPAARPLTTDISLAMLDFRPWKIISIWLVLLICVALAVPSLMPESTAKSLGLGGMSRINLGLDLSGGSHLLLEADTTDLAKQNIAKMDDTIVTEMRRASPAIDIGDISTANGRFPSSCATSRSSMPRWSARAGRRRRSA